MSAREQGVRAADAREGAGAGAGASAGAGSEAAACAQARAERSAAVMLDRDPSSKGLGITLDRVAPGTARMRMQVVETMLNGHGICHGGVLFTFADTAFAVACNSFNRVTVGASAQIDFLAQARSGEVLFAEARALEQRRRSGIYDVVITNAQGKQLVLFRGRSHRLDETLFDEEAMS